jgi:ferredoxin
MMNLMTSFLSWAVVLLIFSISIEAFTIQQSRIQQTTQVHGWMDAFKNDETLGKPVDPGLSKGPNYNENVTVNGKPVQGAVVGQKLTVVAGRARVKIPVNCQKGDCGTCMVLLNGRKVKACQTPLPSGKAEIKTL